MNNPPPNTAMITVHTVMPLSVSSDSSFKESVSVVSSVEEE
jgi:hypothetical protein